MADGVERLWRSKTVPDLEAAEGQLDDYTEAARQVIVAEIDRRKRDGSWWRGRKLIELEELSRDNPLSATEREQAERAAADELARLHARKAAAKCEVERLTQAIAAAITDEPARYVTFVNWNVRGKRRAAVLDKTPGLLLGL